MPKIVILSEGGSKIGFGHITRCIALYEAFEWRGEKPFFVVNADESVKGLLHGKRYEIFNWLSRKKRLFEKVNGSDMAIIDSYLAGAALYKAVSERVRTAVYMDDNKRIAYPKGIVVNGAIYAKRLGYPSIRGASHLLGIKYTPLRKEFRSIPVKRIKKDIQSVMITFGADDLRNMTPRVLSHLVAEFPCLTKKVVIGQGFKNVRQITKAADRRTEFIYYPGVKEMMDAMLGVDVAVSAGGQTLYELARLGVPTVAVAVVKNQWNNVTGWRDAGFLNSAEWWKSKNLLSKISKGMADLKSRRIRACRSAIGRRYVDGRGAVRISDYIINHADGCLEGMR